MRPASFRAAVLAALALAAPALAQTPPSTTFPLGQWTLNPGAERSQVLATGELLAPGRFRVAVQTHGLLTPLDGAPASALQVREHLLASVGIANRFQLAAQLPALVWQSPAPATPNGLARPWVTGRLGVLSVDLDDPLWLAVDLGVGIPGLGQAELTADPAGPVGSVKASVGLPFSHGVFGAEAELRASAARVDLRGGVALASQGIHLKGELVARGDFSPATQRGFVEVLGGVRYVLRPLELSLVTGPGFGLAQGWGFDYRVIAGVGFVTPKEEREEEHEATVDCTEGTAYRLESCPDLDWDNDGLVNRVDRCPKEWGPRENEGCPWPDTDHDTVTDNEDNCPTVPGPPENYGCPRELKQLVVIRKTKLEILDKVFFEFNQAVIKPESFELLDQVAAIIESHPELKKVRIEGHTDKVGSADYNRKLSKERARAVKTYLVQKGGVSPERLTIAGHGFDRPLATNDTDEGRAKNRRVEFMLVQADGEEGEP